MNKIFLLFGSACLSKTRFTNFWSLDKVLSHGHGLVRLIQKLELILQPDLLFTGVLHEDVLSVYAFSQIGDDHFAEIDIAREEDGHLRERGLQIVEAKQNFWIDEAGVKQEVVEDDQAAKIVLVFVEDVLRRIP